MTPCSWSRDTKPPEEQALASEVAATRARDALMTKLVREGYELATFGAAEEKSKKQRAADRARLFRHDQLELALAADPDDAGTWSVYEDWLLAQGDARGAIIEAERLGDLDEAVKARSRIAKLLFPRHGDHLMMLTSSGRWQAGFVRSCWFSAAGAEGGQLLAALVDSPAARFLTELEVDLDRFDRIGTTPRAHVRKLRLHIDTPGPFDARELAPFVDLVEVEIKSVTSVRHHECLEWPRSLSFEYAANLELGDLLSHPLPRLEKLSLDMTDRAVTRGSDVASRVPALRELELVVRPDLGTDAIELVIASGLVPQLERLRIGCHGKNRVLTAGECRAFRGGVLATIGCVDLADEIRLQ